MTLQINVLVRNQLAERIIDAEENIISALVREYRGRTLTDDRVRGAIGEISGLRGILETLESEIRRESAEIEAEVNAAQK